MLSAKLQRVLVERFAEHVMRVAELPEARRADVEQAPRFRHADGEIFCTCGITGSTYAARWNGSDEEAVRLAETAAGGTARLVTESPHYAWLRSGRDSAGRSE